MKVLSVAVVDRISAFAVKTILQRDKLIVCLRRVLPVTLPVVDAHICPSEKNKHLGTGNVLMYNKTSYVRG